MKVIAYTEQVNQDRYEIDIPEGFENVAEEYARNKVKELWKQDYGNPIIKIQKYAKP